MEVGTILCDEGYGWVKRNVRPHFRRSVPWVHLYMHALPCLLLPLRSILSYSILFFTFFPMQSYFFTLPFTVKSIVIFCPLATQQCSLHLRGSNLRMTWLYWLINCRSIVTSQSAVCSRFWKDLYSSQVVSLLISNPSRS